MADRSGLDDGPAIPIAERIEASTGRTKAAFSTLRAAFESDFAEGKLGGDVRVMHLGRALFDAVEGLAVDIQSSLMRQAHEAEVSNRIWAKLASVLARRK